MCLSKNIPNKLNSHLSSFKTILILSILIGVISIYFPYIYAKVSLQDPIYALLPAKRTFFRHKYAIGTFFSFDNQYPVSILFFKGIVYIKLFPIKN